MKKIKIFSILLALSSLFTACKSDLLDTNPYAAIGSGSMWKTESLADLGVNGVYQTLRQDYVGLNRWYFDQDGFTGETSGSTTALTSGTVTSTNGLFLDYWKQNYEGIHRANGAIFNLQTNAPLTPEKKGRLVAECKFLRAWFYFNLNQVYKGVPLYLEPVKLADVTKGRETEAKIWEVIIADLTDCINEPNLPNTYAKGNAGVGRATKAAAYALRGKAYMYTKEFAKAEADLRMVGTLGPQLYTGVYKNLFKEANEQHSEMIFSVQNISIVGLGSWTQKYVGSRASFGSCWNSYMPNPAFVESFENIDGSSFNWDNYFPGYNAMSPKARSVFFLRDGLTAAEIKTFTTYGSDMTKYLPVGNEARAKTAFVNRDPRLAATIITPYSDYTGAIGTTPAAFVLRWPYRNNVTGQTTPFDLNTDTNSKYYYLWRKWVYEGASETTNREFGPIDQPLIRYADVVLLLAEAINEQGFTAETVTLVNSVRTRAGAIALQSTNPAAPTYVNDQASMRERIRNERRWELALEGINLFDEMRWGTWKTKKFPTGAGIKEIWGTVSTALSWRGDYLYNWAIPQSEVQFNSNIIQNDGWIN
jgi:starch-binding outer membrane protein, SusD/RagB family